VVLTYTASRGSTTQVVSTTIGYHGYGLYSVSSADNAGILESINGLYSILSGLTGTGSFIVDEGTEGGAFGTL
jgi:hypothetical protein